MKEFELVVFKNGTPTISDQVDELLDDIMKTKEQIEENEKFVRSTILDAMMKNGILQSKTTNYTFSQVIPKSNVQFNSDEFLLNEPLEITSVFTNVSETETFNLEKFKAENPDIYKKYTETTISTFVDTKRLEKTLPEIYQKYITFNPTTKPITLRVAKNK